jgi:hypothetical protein
MSNDIDWGQAETVEVPQGTFIKWNKVGQVVAGKVLRYSPTGGSDFDGEPCPIVELELLAPAVNFDKNDNEVTLPAGERVAITAGQANLKRGLEEATPKATDKLRVEFSGTYSTTKGSKGKEFGIKIIRGSGNPWD